MTHASKRAYFGRGLHNRDAFPELRFGASHPRPKQAGSHADARFRGEIGAHDHLRKDATVLVLGQDGFTRAKEGTNAFTCLVTRRNGDIFPICWDQEGARTLMPVDIDDAKWRLAGIPTAEIDRRIAEGFAQGRYRAPLRPGVAYMLSPIRYRIDEKGEITRTNPNPHVMAYAPYLTDADVGGKRGSFAFINKPGPVLRQ